MPNIRSTSQRNVEREFSSWHQFVASAADENLYRWKSHRSSHKRDPGGRWYGCETFAQAVDMATRTGWPEGRQMLSDSLAIIPPRPDAYRSIIYDVAGMIPLVPLAIAGDPAAMMDMGDQAVAAQPIVRIDYNHWINAYITPKAMMNRGAAVLSLAAKLEARGYSTELRIIGNSSAGGTAWRYSITYKRAGEPLDLDRAAFAIAHPASMRRLAFAILEQDASLERNFGSGYGMPMREPNDSDTSVVFIQGPQSAEETPAGAMLAVEIAAKAYLIDNERNVA